MASPTQWRWVWVDSGSWWWTGRPGVLWSMGSRRVKTWLSDWTELHRTVQTKAITFHGKRLPPKSSVWKSGSLWWDKVWGCFGSHPWPEAKSYWVEGELASKAFFWFCFFFWVGGGRWAALCSMWDLSSLTRDWTRASCIGKAES